MLSLVRILTVWLVHSFGLLVKFSNVTLSIHYDPVRPDKLLFLASCTLPNSQCGSEILKVFVWSSLHRFSSPGTPYHGDLRSKESMTDLCREVQWDLLPPVGEL
jgi:hypothetical protein